MEIFFLNFIQAISDNWYWLGPLWCVCMFVLIGYEVKKIFRDIKELKDMD